MYEDVFTKAYPRVISSSLHIIVMTSLLIPSLTLTSPSSNPHHRRDGLITAVPLTPNNPVAALSIFLSNNPTFFKKVTDGSGPVTDLFAGYTASLMLLQRSLIEGVINQGMFSNKISSDMDKKVNDEHKNDICLDKYIVHEAYSRNMLSRERGREVTELVLRTL